MAGNSNQQEAVGGVLNNPNAALKERFRALFTLKNLGGEEAIKQISRCFTDPSALLKHECAYCLGQMQDELAIPFLTQVLKDTAQEAMVRHEAGTWSSHSWHWGQSTCACCVHCYLQQSARPHLRVSEGDEICWVILTVHHLITAGHNL